MSNYPDIEDEDFYNSINKKFYRYKIPKKQKTLKQICFPDKYEFQIPQLFLSEFMNPKTPYTGLLIYHRIGAGKTCTAINIAEKFKKIKKIMIVLPASLIGNFRAELRSQCAGEKYLSNVEREQLKKNHPSSLEYKEIIKKSDDRIDTYYTIYSYNKFIKLLQLKKLNLKNTLLIIDEVHNMISESGTYYETLYKAVHSAPGDMRIVIMSATPIFDKPMEIALTMNLLLKDKQLPTGQDFINTFMDITYTEKGPVYTVKNMDLFKEYIRGYVSYYRGAPPHTFPRTELYFPKIKMSDWQYKIYRQIVSIEVKMSNVKDYVNNDISNSFFIGTRMISNVAFPNGRIGEAGYDSLTENDLSVDNIKKYSPKFLRILRKIRKCDGTLLIYSNFKEYGGIKTFSRFLEHYGFRDYESQGEGKKRFAIWSSDQKPIYKEEIKAVFNNKNNVDGSKIKLVLLSPSAKEGISFLRVQEMHIMEPYWNFSRMSQIMGRAIRFCSHKDVPPEKRLVKVYIYMAVHPDLKISIDQYIMNMAITKEKINQDFERALKEAAIDCVLFKNANVYPGEEDIICEE
jgi:hypothetical protein